MPEYRKCEFIKSERKYINLSQKKTSDGLCENETFSRYETGKVVPSDAMFFEIMRKLGKDTMKFYIPNGENNSIHQAVQRLNDNIYLNDVEYVKMNMNQILNNLDDTLGNMQIIERCKLFVNYKTKIINVQDYANRLVDVIRLSSPKYFFGKKLEVKYHSKEEIYLLDDLARVMFISEDYEKAKQLVLDIENYYNSGFIKNAKRNMCLSILFRGKLLRDLKEFELSENLLRKGIGHCSDVYRDDYLPFYFSELSKLYYEIGMGKNKILVDKAKLYEDIAEFLNEFSKMN